MKGWNGLTRRWLSAAAAVAANPSLQATEATHTLRVIRAETRVVQGSRPSRDLRLKNKIPGVIYGSDWPNTTANGKKISITVDEKDLKVLERDRYQALMNTLFEVVVDEKTKFKAIMRGYQLCPYTEQPLSVSFLRYRPGTRLSIPVLFINQDDNIDIRRGAHIHVINSFVKVICTRPNDIPPQIYVDVANVKAGEAIRLSNCNLPSGVFPLLGRGTDLVLAKLEKD